MQRKNSELLGHLFFFFAVANQFVNVHNICFFPSEKAQFIWMPTIQFTVNQVEMKFTRVIRQQFGSALTNGSTKDKNAVRH